MSIIYRNLVSFRLWLYKVRIKREHNLGCLVVSIGNLTVGGTGKTPIVEKFAKSKSDLLISKLNYENIIGKISDPNQLQKNSNAIVSIPNTLNEAINLSKQNNPDILIAKLDLEKSEKDLAISETDLKPSASLSLERSYSDDLTSTIDEREKDTLKATISWPFYSGGKKRSKISKNSNLFKIT